MFGKGKRSADQPEWDQTFEPLMKLILGKKGIKTKTASEVGQKKVDYFRGKDFKKFISDNPALLKKKCADAVRLCSAKEDCSDAVDVDRLGDELISRGFCFKAAYKPIHATKSDANAGEKPVKKWPDKLQRTNNQKFESDGFYVITYKGASGLQHVMLGLIILGVLLACMFPVWPIWAKIGIWYLSVLFLVLYFGVLILRLIAFTLFWIVGVDFWIFPNINDEYCGLLDSFQPLYSFERRKDDAFMLLVRFCSLAILGLAIQEIAATHSLADITEFAESSMTDLLDWGIEKIVMLPGSDKQALPSLEQLQEQHDKEDNETAKQQDPMDSKWFEGAEDEDDDVEVVEAA